MPAAKQTKQESPRERFIRLAEGRTAKALEAIVQLRMLANRDRYQYNDADVAKITEAITSELAVTTRAFAEGHVPPPVSFHL